MRKLDYEEIFSARPTLEQVCEMSRFPVSVVLENIRSLYNVGSMFRTCDGAGIEMLCLCGYTGRPPRKEIDKTALGSAESVPWTGFDTAEEAITLYRDRGYSVVALEHTDCGELYDQAEYDFPLCLVLGNEVEGVTHGALALCHRAVEIPMYGLKQSLNVAVACGIITYHAVNRYLALAQKK